MQAERRHSPRRDCLKTGNLVSRDGAVFWDCLVWNVSHGGAMVELDPDSTPPSLATLSLPALNIHRTCRRVWQRGRKAGLQFID